VPCICFYVVVVDLTDLLAEPLLSETGGATRIGKFYGPQDGDSADLSPLLEDTMQLRKEVPLELVVNTFRKLVSSLLELLMTIATDTLWFCIRTCGTLCSRRAAH
jgi:hypothetical protein